MLGLLCGVLLAVPALAAETGDLELREGYVDPVSGVKVESIVLLPDEGMQAITLSVPRETGPIEEVIVTARRPEQQTIPQHKAYTFVRDYDNDHYGLILYLGKDHRLPIRLFMAARQPQPGAIGEP